MQRNNGRNGLTIGYLIDLAWELICMFLRAIILFAGYRLEHAAWGTYHVWYMITFDITTAVRRVTQTTTRVLGGIITGFANGVWDVLNTRIVFVDRRRPARQNQGPAVNNVVARQNQAPVVQYVQQNQAPIVQYVQQNQAPIVQHVQQNQAPVAPAGVHPMRFAQQMLNNLPPVAVHVYHPVPIIPAVHDIQAVPQPVRRVRRARHGVVAQPPAIERIDVDAIPFVRRQRRNRVICLDSDTDVDDTTDAQFPADLGKRGRPDGN